jgi:hypothetical protein
LPVLIQVFSGFEPGQYLFGIYVLFYQLMKFNDFICVVGIYLKTNLVHFAADTVSIFIAHEHGDITGCQ